MHPTASAIPRDRVAELLESLGGNSREHRKERANGANLFIRAFDSVGHAKAVKELEKYIEKFPDIVTPHRIKTLLEQLDIIIERIKDPAAKKLVQTLVKKAKSANNVEKI